MQQKRVCVDVHRLNYEAIYQIRKYKIIYIYICGVRYVCHSSEDTSANLSQNAIWSVTSCKHHLGKPVTLSLISGQRISGGGCRQVVVGLGQTAHHHISIIYISNYDDAWLPSMQATHHNGHATHTCTMRWQMNTSVVRQLPNDAADISPTMNVSSPLKPSVIIWLHFECSAPKGPNLPFLIFDIPAFWRSGLSARVPECQKFKK